MKKSIVLFTLVCVMSVGGGAALQALMAAENEKAGNKGYIELEQKEIRCAAFSPDGKYVATGGSRSGAVAVIWNRSTGKKVRTLQHHDEVGYGVEINLVVFSPDGKKIATTGSNGDKEGRYSLVIWDIATGKKEHTIKEKDTSFDRCILFSPNSKLLLTDINKQLAIVSVEKGIVLKSLPIPSTNTVTFSLDGKKLLTYNSDRYAKVIDIATGDIVDVSGTTYNDGRRHPNGAREVRFIAFSQDGTKVYQTGYEYKTSDLKPPIFDSATGHLLAVGEEAEKMVAKSGSTKEAEEVDPAVRRAALQMRRGPVDGFVAPSALSFSRGNDADFFGKNYELYKPKYDHTIGCYDIETGNTVYAFHQDALAEQTWKSRMQTDFSDFADRVLKTDIPKPEKVSPYPCYYAETTSGELLVLTELQSNGGKTYNAIFIKDGKTPAKAIQIDTNVRISSYDYISPDGNYYGKRLGHDSCAFWSLRTGKKIGTILTGRVEECIFSPDGKSFMVRVYNGNEIVVQIWDMKSVAALSNKQAEQQEDAEKILREAL